MNYKTIITSLLITFIMISCNKESQEVEISHTKQDKQVVTISKSTPLTNLLINLTSESKHISFEAGYFIYPSVSQTFRFERIEGKKNEPLISLQPKNQIAGVVHCHYSNLFPSFSGSDVKAIYELYSDEHMNDFSTFFCGVVSYTGRGYMLMIEDLEKFLNYSAENFDNQNQFRNFELSYFKKQQIYLSDEGFEGSYEFALADLLNKSGLALYKANIPFREWYKLTFENGKIKQQKITQK